jgi:glycerate kinase
VVFLLAPDSLKGSLSAPQACSALARGIRAAFPEAEIVSLPLADGGEGTVEALVASTGGEFQKLRARGPLGETIETQWALLPGNCAAIEMASASGLTLLPTSQRNALKASSYGTGQQIRTALDAGCEEILIGIGGSATTDGGAGALTALGIKFFDKDNCELPPGGAALKHLARTEATGLHHRLKSKSTVLRVLCDVSNPLYGTEGAAHVYAPQKGASPADVEILDSALRRFAEISAQHLGEDFSHVPGAGAAGGAGFGFMTWLGAGLVPGIDTVLQTARFDEKCARADWVFTAEGSIDAQTLSGKAIAGVARAARKHNIPVVAFGGAVKLSGAQLDELGIKTAVAIPDEPLSLSECFARADDLLAAAAERTARLLVPRL